MNAGTDNWRRANIHNAFMALLVILLLASLLLLLGCVSTPPPSPPGIVQKSMVAQPVSPSKVAMVKPVSFAFQWTPSLQPQYSGTPPTGLPLVTNLVPQIYAVMVSSDLTNWLEIASSTNGLFSTNAIWPSAFFQVVPTNMPYAPAIQIP
jgi:hypothetical protein